MGQKGWHVLTTHEQTSNKPQAINHAVVVWKVDIISMSWGFEDTSEPIAEAIRANAGKTIMFAAAANHGGNESHIAFPANMDTVICVKASNGLGTVVDYSPKTTQSSGPNFFTLGKDVLSMWPTQTLPPGHPYGVQVLQKRATGTSVATPIAAAIAALILEFIRQSDSEPTTFLRDCRARLQNLDARDAMKRILTSMSEQKETGSHGFARFITPWLVLKNDLSEVDHRRTAAKQMFDCLKH